MIGHEWKFAIDNVEMTGTNLSREILTRCGVRSQEPEVSGGPSSDS